MRLELCVESVGSRGAACLLFLGGRGLFFWVKFR